MATEQTWGTILQTNNADLLVRIDTENGLDGAVKTLGLGTKLQLKNIWGVKGDTIKRNERLLEFLRKGDFKRFKIFCEALVISGQESIVADLLSNVKVIQSKSTDMPDDPRSLIPLKESYRDCLRLNWNYLLEEIDNLNEIEAELKARRSLTTFQQIRLQDISENLDKVSRLLTLLENGSQKLFDDFSEILNVTKKQYLVVTLTPSDAQRGLDNVKKTFLEVKLEPTSDIERQRKLKEIESEAAYPVSNGVVKGRVLIFSNRYFVDHRMKPRNGTEHDEKNLNDFFGTNLKFTTDLYSDMTSQEIRKTLKDEAKKDMSDFDIFIVFFLSHGKNGEIYGLDGKTVLTSEIVDCLDGKGCTQLVGKPKLIFIQACRNVYGTQVQDETDGLTPVLEMNNLTMNDADPKEKANPAPHDADPKVKANPVPHDADPKVEANPASHDADPKVKANPAPHDADPKEKANPATHDADPKEKANPATHDAEPKEKANPAPHDAEPKEKANPAPHDAGPKVEANPAPHDAEPKEKANPAPHDADPKVKANPTPNDSDPKVKANPAPHDADPKLKANLANDAVPEVETFPTYHVKADMAIFYATVRGDPSYRREDEGSFFVRHLLDVFTRKAHTEDVLTMVTEALRLVHALQKRQLGEQKSSLLRKVYLVI